MANSAGQGQAWAAAVRDSGMADARNGQLRRDNTNLVFGADITVKQNVFRLSRAWGRKQRRILTEEYTNVVVESANPVLGACDNENTEAQVNTLLASGLDVALLWHGSDIRLPSIHAELTKDSPFIAPFDNKTKVLEKQAKAHTDMADHLGLLEFVSTPDLLQYRTEATWLPILVNENIWQPVPEPTVRPSRRPRVIHVPSRHTMKGTFLIRPILQRLHEERIIEYIELSNVAPNRMPEVIGRADLLVEQMGMDLYGTAALEAMSQGVPVVGQVGKYIRNYIHEQKKCDVPIAEANKDTLRDVIVDLAHDSEKRLRLAKDGLRYLRNVHSPQRSAAILEKTFLTKSI